jgi:nitroimidazol reductase NimA-like FMN-containing flavoprotein (pyridoxamine 5'-phosphate oxidase superfamily)
VSPPLDPRTRLEVLDRAECVEHLRRHHLGRLGFVAGGRPLILPVNYALDGEHVVFRTDEGTKLHAVVGAHVAFEIDEVDNVYHSGWSVVVLGRAEIAEAAEHASLGRLPLGPWCPGPKQHWIRIRPEVVSGRRIVADEVAAG